jgi:translation initiation factor 2B subunit (eIF-2B alpha/beta/delta family)
MPAKAAVMIFSSSASVLGILREAHRRQKQVAAYVCESRPLLEGRRLARMLAEEGIKINLIVDAAAGYFIPKTDLVLVGADSISEEDFVNKIGTFALGVLARRHKKPFWVAAEENKFISREARGYPAISGDPAEVWQQSQPNITCLNPYFEVIPLELVDKILTNQGLLTPFEVPNFVRQFPLAPELVEL